MADTPTPPPNPAGDPPPANPDPAAPPPTPSTPPEGDPPPEAIVKPDWLPDNLWDADANKPVDFATLRQIAPDLPSSPDAFTVPEKIGEFETAQIDQAFLGIMRKAAFDNGIGQAGFEQLLTDYASAAESDADTYYQAQQQALGQNVEARTQQLSTFLDGRLKPEEAEAIRSVATNALVFQGLERLMNGAPMTPREPAPAPATRKSRAEIDTLMASPAYSGRSHQRDANVVKEVTDWFAEEARLEEAKRAQP